MIFDMKRSSKRPGKRRPDEAADSPGSPSVSDRGPRAVKRKYSTAWIGGLALLCTTALVLTAFGAADYQRERQHRLAALHQSLTSASEQLTRALELPLWELDVAQIDNIVEGVMVGDENIQTVLVQDERRSGALTGRTRGKAWRPTAASAPPSGEGLSVLSRAIVHHGSAVGSVTVWTTDRLARQAIVFFLLNRAAAVLVVNTVLALVLWLLFRRYVLLPLREVESYARRVSQGEDGVRLPWGAFPRELGSLRDSIESMVADLNARYRELAVSKAALAVAESRYRGILEGALEGIYQTEVDGTILVANPALARMFGYDSLDSFLKEVEDIRTCYVDRRDRDRLIGQLLRDGQVHDFEGRFKRRDGGTVWLSTTARLVVDAADDQRCIAGMVQDVTLRREAEEALRESEARFRALFENAPLPYQSLDENGICLDVNRNWLELLGYGKQEVLGRWFGDFLAPESVGTFAGCFSKFKQEGIVDDAEFNLVKKSGETIRITLNGRVQPDGQGRFLRTHCIFTDITERRKAEEILREREAMLRSRLDYVLSPDADVDTLELSSVLDIPAMQSILEVLYELTGVPVGFFEADGKLLAHVGWQDICTKFHRVHPVTRLKCVESDTHLNQQVLPGEYAAYKCFNGLWDVVTPIFIGDRHVGNIFIGQFFYEEEQIDTAFFESQAEQYGFDRAAYLDALARVPRVSRRRVEAGIAFYVKFAGMMSHLGFSNLKLAKAVWNHKRAEDDLRRHRDELAANQEKLHLAMEMANLAPWEYDYGGDAYLFNDHFFALYGTSCLREGSCRMSPETYARGFLSPADAHLVRQGIDMFGRINGPDSAPPLEHAALRRDGQKLTMLTRAAVIRDASGRALKLVGATQDITDRKRAEEALRESEEKYRVLIESANDAVFLHGLAEDGFPGPFVEVNETACRRLGYTRQAFARMRPQEVDAPDAQGHLSKVMEHLRRDGVAVFETVHVASDGRRIPVEVSSRLVELRGQSYVLSFARDITERKQAEDALRASEERYRDLYLNTPVMLHSIDTSGRLVAVSDTWCEKLGYIREEVIGRSVLDFITEDSKRIAREVSWPRYYATGQVEDIPYQFIARDGRIIEVLLTARAERDEGGNIVRSLAVLMDVTRRKQAEDALRASEARYRLLLETIPLGVAIVSPEMRVLSMNAKMREWAPEVDAAQNPVCHRSFNDPAIDEPCPWCPVVKTLEDGNIHESVTATPHKDGVRPFRIIACPLHDAQGRVTAVIEIVEDIAERLATEDALRRSERKYRNLLDNIPLNIIYKDRNSVFVTVNAYFAAQTGFPPETFVGKTDYDFYEPALAERYRADDQRIMDSGIAEEFDEPYRDAGRDMTIHTVKMPVRDESGRIESILVIFWDITESRRVESAMREAEKMAAMGTLAGGVAHDFNNILGSIANLALLAKGEVPKESEARQDLEQILESATVGKELVRQILTFCRPEKEIRRVFDPATVVAKTLRLMRPSFPADIEIRERLIENRHAILADPSQFRQIVLNLCANAVDAMRGRPGVLTVELDEEVVEAGASSPHPSLATDRYVTLHVGDTGSGIEPAQLGRIFEPFFSSKPKGRGTGLGLAVVHGIVSRHDGVVTVRSQPGQGSVFTAYFPLCDMDEEFEELKAVIPVRGKGRILFVDDESIQAETGRRILNGYGYCVTVCSDGVEALATLRAAPEAFDLMMTDLTMPNMDGKALAMEALALRPDLPIILCTGHCEAFPPDEARRIGIREYMHKPVDWNRLSIVIAGLLDRKG